MRPIKAKDLADEVLRRGGHSAGEARELGESIVDQYGAEGWLLLCHPSELESLGERARNGRNSDGSWSCGEVVCTLPLVIADWPDLKEDAA